MLGGGISFLGRKYGLSANHVRAIELVTADGQLVRADREHEQDLFWALRGGGGSFGVVTSIEVELLPVKQVCAGILWYPVERESEVLHTWRNLTQDERLPDDLTTIGRFLNFPSFPELPEEIRGKAFVVVEAIHVGDPAQADELLAPLRKLGPVDDTVATIPMPRWPTCTWTPRAHFAGAAVAPARSRCEGRAGPSEPASHGSRYRSGREVQRPWDHARSPGTCDAGSFSLARSSGCGSSTADSRGLRSLLTCHERSANLC